MWRGLFAFPYITQWVVLKVKKVAVLSSNEVRDGLLMMVASHRIFNEGYTVTTFHNRLPELSEWFFPHELSSYPSTSELQATLANYDMLILQHDGSERTKQLKRWHKEGMLAPMSVFYPLYQKRLHPPLNRLDRVFDKRCSMVDNISLAVSSLLNVYHHSKNNGICPPPGLVHRKYKKRVIILPHELLEEKFAKITEAVRASGFEVLLIRNPETVNLAEAAKLIYESGYLIGCESDLTHLASNLQIPTLMVMSKKILRLWFPGWLKSAVVTPPRWLPRTIEKFVHTSRVLSGFKNLVAKDKIYI